MNELGRQLENLEGGAESAERVLGAIEFQTAILTLNAAVEAAHGAETASWPTLPAGQGRSLVGHMPVREAEGSQERTAAPLRSDSIPSMSPPSGTTPPTAGACGAPAEAGAPARLWQRSLERLRQSLVVACDNTFPIDADGRPEAEKARPQPAAAPEPVPVRQRRRPQAARVHPRDRFERGA